MLRSTTGGRVDAAPCLVLLNVVLTAAAQTAWAQGEILDHFESLDGWITLASPGAQVTLSRDAGYSGAGMRVDFDFSNGGAYIILRKELAVALPEDYAFTFHLRGEAEANNFEFKLIDAEAQNVWWRNHRDFAFPFEWRRMSVRKPQLVHAWGPDGSAVRSLSAIEIAISRGSGGKGSIWIDDLRFEERAPVSAQVSPPSLGASAAQDGQPAALAYDGDPQTAWRSGYGEEQWLQIDFLQRREYGGLAIDWDESDYGVRYEVQTSNDGETWEIGYIVTAGNGGRDYIGLPDAESRYLRLVLRESSRGRGYALREIELKPYEFSASPNQLFRSIAGDSPRGNLPRYFYDEQSYWTVVGAGGDDREGLLNQDGMLETDKASFSIEPFLYKRGRLVTWNEVTPEQSLERGDLPIPTVTWRTDPVILGVTAFATGAPGAATLYARYRLQNAGSTTERVTLFLAVRPFQVNPPWQALNMTGGVARIDDIDYDGRRVLLNHDRSVWPLSPPDRAGAAIFEQYPLADYLRADRIPKEKRVHDPMGYASAVLAYDRELPPGGVEEIFLAIPVASAEAATGEFVAQAAGPELFQGAVNEWARTLDRVDIRLPEGHRALIDALRTTLAHVLINRDGAALQPGSRCYARSWIRDGALTSSALLAFGRNQEVRDFIRWYAGFQNPDGGIPCCVDARGADQVVENDSHGEFLYLLAEYFRYTHDVELLREVWPRIVRTVDYIDALRRQRMTPEYEDPAKLAYFGLLPESISHEGYASRPVHAYWDDFWTLRGLKDAAMIAESLEDAAHAARFAALRDAFERDLHASIERTMSMHGIDYLPASVELGDFDPVATTVALSPGGDGDRLPQQALTRTFDIFYSYFGKRRDGLEEWGAYTPYELRVPGALLRMDQKARAWELLEYFLKDRRPLPWNQWPEILWRDPKAPRFIGDLPHTWVGSDYIRTVRSLFVYERESDRSLVIGAGLLPEWLPGGVIVNALPTWYGPLSYSLRGRAGREVEITVTGELSLPPGGIEVRSPLDLPIRTATVNGRDINAFNESAVHIDELPAHVVLHY